MDEKTKKGRFCGVATALITPFRGEELDIPAFRRLIRMQMEAKIDALVVAGTTGEAPTLSEKERDTLLYEALSEVKGEMPVIMGCGSNDTAHAVRYAKRAAEMGADSVLVVTPYYNKGTKEGLRAHFLRVAEEGGSPVILYNVPSRTGVDISLEDYDLMLSHPRIVGIKEAGSDISKLANLCHLAKGRAEVYSGNDAMLLPSLALGASGIISVASGALPKNMRKIYSYFCEGEHARAIKSNEELLRFYELLFKETSPAPIKHVLSLLGYGDGSLRLPLTPPSNDLKNKLEKETERLFKGEIFSF